MCGILGFLDKRGSAAVELLDAQLPAISDRGIFQSKLIGPGVAFGYARLPTDAVQNSGLNILSTADDRVFLYNGILTNVGYLKATFSLDCDDADTVVLRDGISRHGVSFLKHCRGMFAAALVDQEKVVLVRDTIGIKPLYYLDSDELFGFSSTLRGLCHPRIESPVTEVSPGEVVTFYRGPQQVVAEDYTYTPYRGFKKIDLLAALTEALVTPTVRYLSQPSQPRIGLLLSGGLDSSILLKLLVDNLSAEQMSRVALFTIGYPNADDVQKVRRLCADLHVTFTHLEPHGEEYSLDILESIVRANESPETRVARIGLLYDVLATEIERQGIQVLIAGEGADELFYGYERFNDGLSDPHIDELYKAFFKYVFPRTLLQRFDRSFAGHRIEGRVPFLDQEVVEVSRGFSSREKVGTQGRYKLPLRELAKDIGLPSYISERPKVKMGVGATGQVNVDTPDGYLERACLERFGTSLAEQARKFYEANFVRDGKDVQTRNPQQITEDELTRWAGQFRKRES